MRKKDSVEKLIVCFSLVYLNGSHWLAFSWIPASLENTPRLSGGGIQGLKGDFEAETF